MLELRGDLRVDPLVRGLARRLRREGWMPRGLHALVAVSGGGDSMALLLALGALAPEFDWRLDVFHANHGLRGKAAQAAESLVREAAESLSLPLHVERLELEKRAQGRSIEEIARVARLETLRMVALETKAGAVVLGHTRDDLAETVLHRALRGTGLTGLAAMRPVSAWRDVTLIRPLLNETRRGLRDFLSAHDAPWDEDETNAHLSATRNRIRHTVRPLLAREVNERADEALARLAQHAAQDDAQLEADVDALVTQAGLDLTRDESLPLEWLRALSPSLARRAMRRWMMAIAQCPLPPSSRQVEEAMAKIHTEPSPPRWTTFGGLIFGFKDGQMRVTLPKRLEVLRWPRFQMPAVPLRVGEPVALLADWTLEARESSVEEAKRAIRERADDPWIAFIDAGQIEGDLQVRTRATGDVFQPFGTSTPKSLRRFMSDERLPRCARGQLPLVCDAKKIIWIAGNRIADCMRITEKTRDVLHLRVTPPAP